MPLPPFLPLPLCGLSNGLCAAFAVLVVSLYSVRLKTPLRAFCGLVWPIPLRQITTAAVTTCGGLWPPPVFGGSCSNLKE